MKIGFNYFSKSNKRKEVEEQIVPSRRKGHETSHIQKNIKEEVMKEKDSKIIKLESLEKYKKEKNKEAQYKSQKRGHLDASFESKYNGNRNRSVEWEKPCLDTTSKIRNAIKEGKERENVSKETSRDSEKTEGFLDSMTTKEHSTTIRSRKGAVLEEENYYQENKEGFELEKTKPQKRSHPIKKVKNHHVLVTLMSILGIVSVTFAVKSNAGLKEEEYAVFGNADQNGVEASSSTASGEEQASESSHQDTKPEEKKVVTTTNKANTNTTNKTSNTSTPKVVPLAFVKPLNGEVQKIYSNDKVIYSKTLELWKTHDGIDIKAEVGTVVKSIEKGTIEKVYLDSFYGMTIVIDHGQGYKSSYSNLEETVSVKEKQVVAKGTKIGKIGKTSIGEVKDDSHLHFTLLKNNTTIDPSSVLK